MGRARSRRRRGKTGGAGSGGSGSGKGTGGSRGRSSNNRGGQGKGGSGTGGTGGSRGRSNNTRGGQAKANRNQNMKANKAVAKAKTVAKVAGKLGKDFANDPKGFPSRHLTGFIGEQPANATDLGSRIGTSIANSPLAHKYNQVDNYVNPRHPRVLKRLQEKTGRDYNTKVKAGEINLSTKAFADFVGISDKNWYKNNVPGFIRNARINKQLYGHPTVKGWHSSQRTGRGHGVKKDDLKIDQGPQAIEGKTPNVTISKSTGSGGPMGGGIALANALQIKKLQQDKVKAEEKALDTQYKQDQAIYNNNKNNMTTYFDPLERDLTSNQQKLDQIFNTELGRSASYGTKGGADYWLDTHAQGDTVDWDNITRMIAGSDEGKKFAASKTTANPAGIARVGGIDPNKSISSQAGPGTWASHFAPGGKFANENAAGAATAIAKDINFGRPKPVGQEDGVNITPDYFNTGVTDQTGADNTGTTIPPAVSDGWWNQFADADAFKTFLQGDAKEETKADNGMGDFMKFMMLMNVMGGGRGGGGGYGGSQFGYGGMSPGGVQAAYDPMKQLQGMGTWFKDNFGSGSTSTGNINAT